MGGEFSRHICLAQMPNALCDHDGMDNPVDFTLADNVKRLMAHHRLAQAGVAKRAGMDQKTISRIIRREHSPSIDKLSGLAEAFGLQAWQLLVPYLDPSNPPVVQMTPIEKDLYDRLKQAAALLLKQ